MYVGTPTLTMRARKTYQCDWCAEEILPGSPYCHWFCTDPVATTRMHPECLGALHRLDLCSGEELPAPGTFGRGSTEEV